MAMSVLRRRILSLACSAAVIAGGGRTLAFAPRASPSGRADRPVPALSLHLSSSSSSLAPPNFPNAPYSPPRRISVALFQSKLDGDGLHSDTTTPSEGNRPATCWNPDLRKLLGVLSSLGVAETAYLTYDKVQYSSGGGGSSLVGALCSDGGGASSCSDVLHGPYASLHVGGIDVPLSALGAAAYTVVFLLATVPLFSPERNYGDERGNLVLDGDNRIAILGATTLMASFSVYLMSLLLGVLHASCPFCFLSAGLSISMAGLSWFGGMLPGQEEDVTQQNGVDELLSEVTKLRKNGITAGASSVGLATVVALGLFLGAGDDIGSFDSLAASSAPSSSSGTSTLVASASGSKSYRENVPPPVTTTSSRTALALASDLRSLDSRMFGAFWCSHCYDQKQAFGYEAMQSIPYVECDREGYNNRRDLCKERDVPGYPTWEIGGELFPGERSLEELQEIVNDVKSGK